MKITSKSSREQIGSASSITTTKAAQILGISVYYVKYLADQKEIKSWITPGGHYKIDLNSLLDYQKKSRPPLEDGPDNILNKSLVMKLISVNIVLNEDVKHEFSRWKNLFELSFWDSIPEAYLSFTEKFPDVIILQMSMPERQQLSVVETLENFLKKSRKPISVICMSDWDKLKDKINKNIDTSIQFVPHTLNPNWIRAFMMGFKSSLSIKNSIFDKSENNLINQSQELIFSGDKGLNRFKN